MMFRRCVLVILSIMLKFSFGVEKEEGGQVNPLLLPGKCAGLWRQGQDGTLPGKCFGVNPTHEFSELKEIKIKHFRECRSLCCNLKDKCQTWQYQNSTGTCFIQKGAVRKGFEGANTEMYCDPFPPSAWNGHRLESRSPEGVCKWGEELPNQCFGFGPERFSPSKERLDKDQCAEACCKDLTCDSYQELPDRGCYFGSSTCHKGHIDGAFDGGRKCVPNFCGGNEARILAKYGMKNPMYPKD